MESIKETKLKLQQEKKLKMEKLKSVEDRLFAAEQQNEKLRKENENHIKNLTEINCKLQEQNNKNIQIISDDANNVIGINRIEAKISNLLNSLCLDKEEKNFIFVMYRQQTFKIELEDDLKTFKDLKAKVKSICSLGTLTFFFTDSNGVVYPDSFDITKTLYPIEGMTLANNFATVYVFDITQTSKKTQMQNDKKNENQKELKENNEEAITKLFSYKTILEALLVFSFTVLNILWCFNTLQFQNWHNDYLINNKYEGLFNSLYSTSTLYQKEQVLSNITDVTLMLYNTSFSSSLPSNKSSCK